MRRLLLDFNNRDPQGWIRIGPATRERLKEALAGAQAGERVEGIDHDGNRCEGTLRVDNGALLVEPDWASWVDGGAALTR